MGLLWLSLRVSTSLQALFTTRDGLEESAQFFANSLPGLLGQDQDLPPPAWWSHHFFAGFMCEDLCAVLMICLWLGLPCVALTPVATSILMDCASLFETATSTLGVTVLTSPWSRDRC